LRGRSIEQAAEVASLNFWHAQLVLMPPYQFYGEDVPLVIYPSMRYRSLVNPIFLFPHHLFPIWNLPDQACLVKHTLLGALTDMNTLQNSRTVRGCIQGDSIPDPFVPRLVCLYRAGKVSVERIITFYSFADVDQAVAESSPEERLSQCCACRFEQISQRAGWVSASRGWLNSRFSTLPKNRGLP